MPTALEKFNSLARRWNVSISSVQETNSSILGFGEYESSRVVLKVSKQIGDEWHSGVVLRTFDGVGAVRVYESCDGAVLLERLDPGEQLAGVVRDGKDDGAMEVLAEVMLKLKNRVAPGICPTVTDWARGFDRYMSSDDPQVPRSLVEEAHDLYLQLASSQTDIMLLHGDLQHYNVLRDNLRGWLAIDPKGVAGELEYEVSALLRNPVELADFVLKTSTIERRLDLLVTRLNLNAQRVINWSFSQSVLSAIWDVEDGFDVGESNVSLQLARALRAMI